MGQIQNSYGAVVVWLKMNLCGVANGENNMNNIYLRLSESKIQVGCVDQSVNAVEGNNLCLF